MTKSRSNKPAKRGKRENPLPFPVAYSSQPVLRRTIRYKASSAMSGVVVTRGCVECSVIAKSANASSTEALSLMDSFRIKKIRIWAVNDSSPTAMTTISLLWQGSQSPTKEMTANGNAQYPARIVSKPPSMSTSSFWSNEGSTDTEILFMLTGPAGTIVDLTYEYVLHDGANGDLLQLAAATTAVGLFYPPLDSLSASNTAGTGLLVPQGLSSLNLASQ